MKTIASLALAATLAAGLAAPVIAQEGDSAPEFRFVVDRSDISGERSAQAIYAELVATAGAYCEQFGEAARDCTAQMVELAVSEISDSDLTAVHAQVTARDGVMTASYSTD